MTTVAILRPPSAVLQRAPGPLLSVDLVLKEAAAAGVILIREERQVICALQPAAQPEPEGDLLTASIDPADHKNAPARFSMATA